MVSADFSYHAYFETVPHMMLVDIGHYESEAVSRIRSARSLEKILYLCRPQNTDPHQFIRYY